MTRAVVNGSFNTNIRLPTVFAYTIVRGLYAGGRNACNEGDTVMINTIV